MPKPEEPSAGYRIVHGINVILRIVIVIMMLLLLFRIEKVDVTGSEKITQDQVIKWLGEDKKSLNSLYAVWKYNIRKQPLSPAVESAHVTIRRPWHIKIRVREWPPAGMIKTKDSELVFNRDGMVVATEETDNYGVLVTGLTPQSGALYQKLVFDQEDTLSEILTLLDYLEQNALAPDEASWEGAEDGWRLRFGSTYASLGTAVTEEKIQQLAALYPEVSGKDGIIHLESYESGDEIVRFEQGAP